MTTPRPPRTPAAIAVSQEMPLVRNADSGESPAGSAGASGPDAAWDSDGARTDGTLGTGAVLDGGRGNRHGPLGQHDRSQRQREQTRDCERPHEMARRRRRPPRQCELDERDDADEHGRLEDDPERGGYGEIDCEGAHRSSPCSRARFSSWLRCRYSSAESGADVTSSSAAMAEPVELSKNVCSSCFSADRLASSGFNAGK